MSRTARTNVCEIGTWQGHGIIHVVSVEGQNDDFVWDSKRLVPNIEEFWKPPHASGHLQL